MSFRFLIYGGGGWKYWGLGECGHFNKFSDGGQREGRVWKYVTFRIAQKKLLSSYGLFEVVLNNFGLENGSYVWNWSTLGKAGT